MVRSLALMKGRAILTNFNQTAEKRAIDWPPFAELCTDTPLFRDNPIYFYVDELENATLKIGVYSPVAQLDRFVFFPVFVRLANARRLELQPNHNVIVFE